LNGVEFRYVNERLADAVSRHRDHASHDRVEQCPLAPFLVGCVLPCRVIRFESKISGMYWINNE